MNRIKKFGKVGGVLLAGTYCLGNSLFGGVVFQADFKAGKLAVVGGSGTLKAWSTNSIKIKNNLMKVSVDPQSSGGMAAAAQFKPDSAASSMAAIYKNGKLNGTIDFFIGSSRGLNNASPVDNFRVLDLDNRKQAGLRLVVMSVRDELRVEVLGELVAPNGKKNKVLGVRGKYPMKPYKVYHIALIFKTGNDGLVTCKLYAVDGNQAIDTSAAPLCRMAFMLDKGVKNGFTAGNFRYGQMSTSDKSSFTNYFGRLTVYDSIPAQLPGIKY